MENKLMEIKYKLIKKSLIIFSEAKVLSSDFRKWFLIQLAKIFDLYGDHNGMIRLLSNEIIEEIAVLSPSYITDLKNLYIDEKIEYMSFEELLEREVIPLGDIFVFNKGTDVNQYDMRNDNNLLTYINFDPVGDTDYICIENLSQFELFINLIERYNFNNK